MKILILGCGWVGEELARSYLLDDVKVHATVTSVEKQVKLGSQGIQCKVVNFDTGFDIEFDDTSFDYVLTSIPATSKFDEETIKTRFQNIKSLLKHIEFKRHIYLSSVGIYPDIDGLFDEHYNDDLNKRLFIAESIMKELPNTSIFRLGGLFGKNRIFAKYFENKLCTTGGQPSNFIHLDDVVGMLKKSFKDNIVDDIYNIVCPLHPSKEEVIRASAAKYNFDLPSEFRHENSFQKIIDGSKIQNLLNYSFHYYSPIDF